MDATMRVSTAYSEANTLYTRSSGKLEFGQIQVNPRLGEGELGFSTSQGHATIHYRLSGSASRGSAEEKM